jgi:hypothetical protein
MNLLTKALATGIPGHIPGNPPATMSCTISFEFCKTKKVEIFSLLISILRENWRDRLSELARPLRILNAAAAEGNFAWQLSLFK